MPDETPSSEAEMTAGDSSLHRFAHDGEITDAELTFVKKLALRDFRIDARELATLDAITRRTQRSRVSPAAWQEIKKFRHKYGLDPLAE